MQQYHNIKELFIINYYDLPLLLLVQDEQHNYLLAQLDNTSQLQDIYNLYPLTPEQLCLILGQNELFRNYVTDMWDLPEKTSPQTQNEHLWVKYYDMFRQPDGTYKIFANDVNSEPVGFYVR